MRKYPPLVDSPIGRRVYAWKGSKAGQYGTTFRVDGVYHCFVRWDDGDETHYESAHLTRPEFVREK